ncbi:hypothetical protein K503DRAFT_68726 [Rhizopogon vinicolor AM-OR11-026]|uniref:Uncharacterized protein n=1 Tax=Rhizopogon vinicolor AM-OR11-026 TaxID=1314800 RepID=A0A1B7NFV6_9AGAM|nr:hypothetical protein K503DRAFT_68726 [Rhizopogon vinicolor AM-OR11-026]
MSRMSSYTRPPLLEIPPTVNTSSPHVLSTLVAPSESSGTPWSQTNPSQPPGAPKPQRKRTFGDDTFPTIASSTEGLFSSPKRTYIPRRTLTQKLDSLFDLLASPGMRWTIGDLMFNLFQLKDDTFSPSARHGQYVEKFLSGKCGHVVQYQDITSIRPALSAFAAQTVKKRLVQEVNCAAAPENGMHCTVTKSSQEQNELEWSDVGLMTVDTVKTTIQANQPLTWAYVTAIATPRPHKRQNICHAVTYPSLM